MRPVVAYGLCPFPAVGGARARRQNAIPRFPLPKPGGWFDDGCVRRGGLSRIAAVNCGVPLRTLPRGRGLAFRNGGPVDGSSNQGARPLTLCVKRTDGAPITFLDVEERHASTDY